MTTVSQNVESALELVLKMTVAELVEFTNVLAPALGVDKNAATGYGWSRTGA